LKEAGLLEGVEQHAQQYAFQYKNGASFLRGSQRSFYDFREKLSAGPGETFQVRRAQFDHLLAQQAEQYGVDIRFGHEVIAVDVASPQPRLTVKNPQGDIYDITGKFLLDGSGFGRILPKFLDLESPSDFPVRRALFTHIEDGIHNQPDFDREKILITVHEQDHRAWYWLIPFADGRASFGIVAEQDFFDSYGYTGDDSALTLQALFKKILADDVALSQVLQHAQFDTPVRTLVGYAADVKHLAHRNYALLGNAGEFLDPVFSSGVTIALKSASLVVPLLHRYLQGESVDWHKEYEIPLRRGINVFRAYVDAWYSGEFQDVVFAQDQNPQIRAMISALLAGYAWDEANPMNKNAQRRLAMLAEYCRVGLDQSAVLG
ncbi:MAG: tryptophan 7-halogenase, partial [Acinetobacter sp.]